MIKNIATYKKYQEKGYGKIVKTAFSLLFLQIESQNSQKLSIFYGISTNNR